MLKNSKHIAIIWFLTFLFASFILGNSHFKSSSNDSKYYAEMVVRYHDQSWQQIITPKWGENYWGYDPNGYNLDNFPGQTILGVAVTKLGAPPVQALHILGMLFQVFSIFLMVEIAKHFGAGDSANTLFYALLLTPMAFAYNIRANHELGIMFFSILSLYAGIKLPTSKKWGIVSIVAATMLLWIKGPFLIFGIILTTLGYFLSVKNIKNILPLALTIALSLIVIISSAMYFDHLFEGLTGVKFLEGFWKIQIAGRQIPFTSKYSFITFKLYNFYYYSWHYFAYALPWFLFLFIAIIKNKKDFIIFFKSKLSLCFFLSALSFLLVFTMNSRHAARYVFPGYYLFSAWSIFAFYNLEIKFQAFHQKISALGIHFVAPTLWLFIFLLHFMPL